MAGQNGRQKTCLELPYIAVGTARLPNTASDEQVRTLTIELTISLPGNRIVDVASTILLPGYTALLRGLLNGLQVSQIEEAAQDLNGHLSGPFLKPTIAALQKAAAAAMTTAAAAQAATHLPISVDPGS